MSKELLNISDLKALYDFACFYSDLKSHTGTKDEAKKAEQDRDSLFKELESRLDIHTKIIRTRHLR